MLMNDKHQKMQNHAQQEISAKLNNSMMFYVYAFHLAVSVGSKNMNQSFLSNFSFWSV